MLQNIIIGQYVGVTSVLHRLDPRSKLVSVAILVIMIFLADNWLAGGLIIAFALILIFLSNVPLSFIYRGMKPIFLLVLFTVFFHLLLTREGEVLWTAGPFSIYEHGVRQAAFMALRLLTLIVFTSLLTLTTKPIDLTDGLEYLLGPLKKVKLPAHELALMMSIALRFIPTFMQETEKIMKAQMARGVDFTSGPLRQRVMAFVPLLVPLFISAFKRAEDLALAMEARGYRGGEGRTKYRLLAWRWRDSLAVALCLGLSGAVFALRLL
ncbi:energy-coupling factor transporter transmembrane protein EcfT [Alkalihalobacillus oceani]|uniref:energy-coupling factor transporter transmembrane component T family protein n=1 Tax=Halalkalibacter oceani TaxID=1653776 RepID=UPI002040417E|nr:energy-coupling factor transporter transmembrane component T [Halalkalibacter oceani]MCM3762351.1 energy-coupling factor transporter transmembrane protein EcfT [Halalkalibacter oceani]